MITNVKAGNAMMMKVIMNRTVEQGGRNVSGVMSLILTLEGQNNRDHLTFGLTLPPLPLRLTTKNSFLTKDQSSKSLFFYSDLVSYRQL